MPAFMSSVSAPVRHGRSTSILRGLSGLMLLAALSSGNPSPVRGHPPMTHTTETLLHAGDYGVRADGVTDDGPAIARMVGAAMRIEGPVRLVFARRAEIRATTAPRRYVLDLEGAADVHVEGGASTFILGPDVRFLNVVRARRISVRDLNIDYAPLPFADASITAVDAEQRTIEVEAADWVEALPTGGPTNQDGEQTFFGQLWYPGPYGLQTMHYYVERMTHGPTPSTAHIRAQDNFEGFERIVPGEWTISLPVPGIAHRHGPGPCLRIDDSEDVALEDIELWTAPWFGVAVSRCAGEVTFRRVNIRPRPGTGRLTSLWRDGFHVKGNSARLLWEDCVVSGMNDDAFNISTQCSWVRETPSPTEIVVLQGFPIGLIPWHEGALMSAADFETRTLLGQAQVVRVRESEPRIDEEGRAWATPVTLQLDRPIAGLDVGAWVWQPAHANPDTTLRRCRIEMSCRLQSGVALEDCDVTALLWFYGERIEGPFPSDVLVRNCTIRRGRGNPDLAVIFAGRDPVDERPSGVHDVVFENNEVWGDFAMLGVDRARMTGNAFPEEGAQIIIDGCRDLERRDKTQ